MQEKISCRRWEKSIPVSTCCFKFLGGSTSVQRIFIGRKDPLLKVKRLLLTPPTSSGGSVQLTSQGKLMSWSWKFSNFKALTGRPLKFVSSIRAASVIADSVSG